MGRTGHALNRFRWRTWCKSLTHHGSFHLNPFVFGDSAGVQNTQVRVHCWILKDKLQPMGNSTSDLNCTADLLLQPSQVFPNGVNNGYDPTKVQTQMIPYSGTMLEEDLQVNRNRFTVVHHKSWDIVPTGDGHVIWQGGVAYAC
jgi:hypothetical protein